MTKAEFHNGLRLLRFVEPEKLGLTRPDSVKFEKDPCSFFIKCGGVIRDRIWNAMYPEEMPAPDANALPMGATSVMIRAANDWSRGKYGKPIGNDDATQCWHVMARAFLAACEGVKGS